MNQLSFQIIERTREEQEAHRLARIAERALAEEQLTIQEIERLSQYDWPQRRRGRPMLVLAPAIARMVLEDVARGAGYRDIARKYDCFSIAWLSRMLNSGQLELMAGGELGNPTYWR